MKLRRIDSHRYCDEETGTYFEFPLIDFTPEQAAEWIRLDRECFLAQHPADVYFGTDRMIIPLGRAEPPSFGEEKT